MRLRLSISLLAVRVIISGVIPLSVVGVGSPNEACVICSFLMESVDRIIKAQPAAMNGNAFSLGRVDFGGGVVGPEGVGGGSVGENQALRDQGPGNLLSSFPGAGFPRVVNRELALNLLNLTYISLS